MTNSAIEILSRGLFTITMYSLGRYDEFYLKFVVHRKALSDTLKVKNHDSIKRQEDVLIYSLDAFKRVIGGGIALKCYTEATQRFQIVLTLAL